MAALSEFDYKMKIETAQICSTNLEVYLSMWLETEKEGETAALISIALTALNEVKEALADKAVTHA